MPEPKIGETRIFTDTRGYKYKEICVECPICHKPKWCRTRYGTPVNVRHRTCFLTLPISKETCEKMRQSQYKAYANIEVINKHSIATINRYKDPNEIEKTRQKTIEHYKNPEERRKTGERSLKMWADPAFKTKTVRKMILGMQLTPNKPETLLIDITDEYFPNQWEFIGDGGRDKDEFGGVVPDFINREHNLIIEHFGDYSHGKLIRKYHQTEQGRIEILAGCGYKTLIFWEHDMKKMTRQEIAKRIQIFMDNSKNENLH